jgi:hypothetical protein
MVFLSPRSLRMSLQSAQVQVSLYMVFLSVGVVIV